MYGDIRDRHFSAVFPVLRQRAKQLQLAHSKRQEMSVEQMKGFIQGERTPGGGGAVGWWIER